VGFVALVRQGRERRHRRGPEECEGRRGGHDGTW
jgi:hypothetical protein